MAAAALLLLAGVCRADVSDAIARCAASASKDERIACLEQALKAASPGAQHIEPEPEPPSAPAPASAGSPEPTIRRAEPAVVADRVPAARPEPTEPEPAPPAAAFGAERLEQSESSDNGAGIFKAQVVDFDFVGYRRLRVQLANGQVWRQIKGDRTTVDWGLRDEQAFEVELLKAGLGGYRMRVIPVDRIIRVERLK